LNQTLKPSNLTLYPALNLTLNPVLNLALVCSLIIGCTKGENFHPNVDDPLDPFGVPPSVNFSPKPFEDCEHLDNWISKKADSVSNAVQDLSRRIGVDQSAPSLADPHQNHSSPSITNIQVTGVDEADIVKMNEKLVFASTIGSVKVIDPKTLKLVGSISTSKKAPPANLYLTEHYLHAITYDPTEQVPLTTVASYRLKGKKVPSLEATRLYHGELVTTRFTASRLLVITKNTLYRNEATNQGTSARSLQFLPGGYSRRTPVKSSGTDLHQVTCNRYLEPIIDDHNMNAYSLFSLSENADTGDEKALSIIGDFDFYVAPKNIYAFQNTVSHYSYQSAIPEELSNKSWVLAISHDLDDGNLVAGRVGEVDGEILSRWSIKEYSDEAYGTKDFLTIVSQSRSGPRGIENLVTNLLTNDVQAYCGVDAYGPTFSVRPHNRMTIAALSEPFGQGESIRSVKFDHNLVYAVTYEQQDPLHIFEIESEDKIDKISETQAPGFSSYLHKIANGQLIGIGFTDIPPQSGPGIQTSLFDLTDPFKPRLVVQNVLGVHPSYSSVTQEPKSFVYDENRNLAIFPVVLFEARTDIYAQPKLNFSGAVALNADTNLEIIGKMTHWEFIPPTCQRLQSRLAKNCYYPQKSVDVHRTVLVKNKVVSFSLFGAKVHNLDFDCDAEDTLKFEGAEDICSTIDERVCDPRYLELQ